MLINPMVRIDQTEKEILIEVHIADLHFGNNSVDPSTEFQIMDEQFLNPISTVPFDALYIDGDIYDHKVMTNSDTTMYVTMFVDKCVNICRSKGATLVIILGTNSHDADQLKIFYHYLTDPSVDVRIIEQARFENIKGKRVLCLPEEYNKGREYYEKFFYHSGWYDSVAMHGTLVGSVYGADMEDLDGERAVFDINNFCYCKGPIISGHVHTPMCLKGYMYMVGNPVRYKFGEEEAKGYTILIHNIKTREFYTSFQEITSFRYDTINLDYMAMEDPKIIIDHIKSLQNQGIHNIRVEFTVDSSSIDIIKNYFRTNTSIKIKDDREKRSVNNSISVNSEEEYPEEFEQFKFLLDPQLTEYQKLARFINLKKGFVYITTEELIDIVKGVD